jgi:hypothetical protein
MAFQRNYVSDAERLEIGLQVFRYKSMYGLVTNLDTSHRVLLIFDQRFCQW